jgi:hypothetical protein
VEDRVEGKTISRKEGEEGGRKRKEIRECSERSLLRSSWEDGTAKQDVESLCLLRLRDGVYQKVAGQRWLLCAPKKTSMVIPIQNVRSVILKCKCLNWREPKLDAAYFKVFRWGLPYQREP